MADPKKMIYTIREYVEELARLNEDLQNSLHYHDEYDLSAPVNEQHEIIVNLQKLLNS